MNEKVKQIWQFPVEYFSDGNRFADTIWIFRRTVYCFLFFNTLTLLPVADEIFGTGAYTFEILNPNHFYLPLLYFLNETSFSFMHWLVLAGQLVFILMGLSGKSSRLSAILIFLFSSILFNKAQMIANSGYQIILIMLFFLMFMDENRSRNYSSYKVQWVNTMVSYMAFFAARIQLVLLYFFAGVNKLEGSLWFSGEALFYALSLDEFSHPWVKEWILSTYWLIIVMNYLVLGYQLLFPVFIWFKKLRWTILCAGVILHLGIAFIMGLMDFGFAMIACYFVFFTSSASASLKAGIRKISIKGDWIIPIKNRDIR